MNITVIGAGYVGQVVSACLTTQNHNVTVYDIDQTKLSSLQKGIPTIHESGLQNLLSSGIEQGNLHVEEELQKAINDADVVFLCVGTPSNPDGSVNLTYHFSAVEEIKPYITTSQTIVIKSTVPPGTAHRARNRLGQDVTVLSNPEFLKEGSAVQDFLNPDRVIVGGQNKEQAEYTARKIYTDILQHSKLFVTDNASAELAKYAANSFLATKISFINEIARLCEKVGANVDEVADGMGLDARIENAFFGAGVGYGGSCFPKDVKGLIATANDYGEDMKIIAAAHKVNQGQRNRVVDWVESTVGIAKSKIGVWGLSFKPGTDDVRESPAITIVTELVRRHGEVTVYDPQAIKSFKRTVDVDVTCAKSKEEVLQNVDALLVLTDWEEFKQHDIDSVSVPVYDGRNMYSSDSITQIGK